MEAERYGRIWRIDVFCKKQKRSNTVYQNCRSKTLLFMFYLSASWRPPFLSSLSAWSPACPLSTEYVVLLSCPPCQPVRLPVLHLHFLSKCRPPLKKSPSCQTVRLHVLHLLFSFYMSSSFPVLPVSLSACLSSLTVLHLLLSFQMSSSCHVRLARLFACMYCICDSVFLSSTFPVLPVSLSASLSSLTVLHLLFSF